MSLGSMVVGRSVRPGTVPPARSTITMPTAATPSTSVRRIRWVEEQYRRTSGGALTAFVGDLPLAENHPAVVGDGTDQEHPPAVGTGTLECLSVDGGAGQRAGGAGCSTARWAARRC